MHLHQGGFSDSDVSDCYGPSRRTLRTAAQGFCRGRAVGGLRGLTTLATTRGTCKMFLPSCAAGASRRIGIAWVVWEGTPLIILGASSKSLAAPCQKLGFGHFNFKFELCDHDKSTIWHPMAGTLGILQAQLGVARICTSKSPHSLHLLCCVEIARTLLQAHIATAGWRSVRAIDVSTRRHAGFSTGNVLKKSTTLQTCCFTAGHVSILKIKEQSQQNFVHRHHFVHDCEFKQLAGNH